MQALQREALEWCLALLNGALMAMSGSLAWLPLGVCRHHVCRLRREPAEGLVASDVALLLGRDLLLGRRLMGGVLPRQARPGGGAPGRRRRLTDTNTSSSNNSEQNKKMYACVCLCIHV